MIRLFSKLFRPTREQERESLHLSAQNWRLPPADPSYTEEVMEANLAARRAHRLAERKMMGRA